MVVTALGGCLREVADGGDGVVDGLQGWGGVAVEAVDGEEHLRGDGLQTGPDILVERCEFVFHLNNIIVRNDAAVV